MADLDPRSDAELLAATAHEPEAFAAFYRRYARVVLGFVARRVGDAELAADVTSEAFAAALMASDRFDPSRGSAQAWLFGIVTNQLGSAWRRGAAESRARKRLGIERIELAEDQVAWIESLADEQEEALAMQLLAELPEDERSLLEQRVMRGRGYGDLAEELGISETTARKRVSRGLAALRMRFHQGQVAR
jgi:RNA polymerase sigma factor (sigma-70 family)